MKVLKGKGGFTLLEVLIVVAIIIIIAAIATPRFQGVADKGKEARARGDLRVLQTAIESYILNENILPTTSAALKNALENADPNIVNDVDSLDDPFSATDAKNYGFSALDSGGNKLYVFFSEGKAQDGSATIVASGVVVTNSPILVTNAKK